MEATISHPPRKTRLGARMFVFVAIATLPFVWFAYVFASQTLSGGITRGDGLLKVDLKSLGNFPFNQNYDTTKEIPAKWRQLDGQRIELKGYMYSSRSAGGDLAEFEFVYNVAICCFNGPPLVQERVFARVPEGRTVVYQGTSTMVRLVGVLHVGVERDRYGVPLSVYTLDVESADPV